jgi:hypothetical protein
MRSQKYLFHLALMLAVAFFLGQTQMSQAQLPGMPKLYGEFKMPQAGAYVTYKVLYTKNNTERITKLSIVGIEKSEGGAQKINQEGESKKVAQGGKVQPISEPKGEDLYWFEQEETDPKTGEVTIVKMLISGNPQDIKTIHRMIMKSGKEPAQELPEDLIQMINQAPTAKTADQPKIKNLGIEKVKIKDQTMDCTHMRYTSKDKSTADVWNSDKVPLFGMVKSTTADAIFELVGYGTDAVSAIKEQPKVMELPQQK